MASAVPLEISDMIIDCLSADKDALSNCSLTCKSWTPRSRRHLWSCLNIAFGRKPRRTFTDFSELLNASPTLASHIRLLGLRQFRDRPTHGSPCGSVVALLHCMQNLRELDLGLVSFGCFDDFQGQSESLTLACYIKRLSLSDTDFASIGDFHRFMRCFPVVQELDLSGFQDLGDPDEYTDNARSHSLVLKRLEVGFNDDPQTGMSWLAILNCIEVGVLRVTFILGELANVEGVPIFCEAWKKCIQDAEALS